MEPYLVRDVAQRNSASDGDTTLVLLLEVDVGGRLVDTNTEALQFVFDDTLVNQRLVDIENDEDQVTGLGHSNDLATTTLTVLRTLNNTGKIENLNFGTVVHNLSGHCREGRELVCSSCELN